MINIQFKIRSGKLVSFNISGHAGYAESGEDIVCSAVSALAYTFINGIVEVAEVDAVYHIDDNGLASLDLSKLDDQDIEKCQVLMKTMLLGIKSMEVNYGDYIRVKVEEV